MSGKPKTTTQRLYMEDVQFVKDYQRRFEKPTFAEAFHMLLQEYQRLREWNKERKELIYKLREELEEKERLIRLKNEKLYECLEANKALQMKVEELERKLELREQSLNNCIDQLAELRSKSLLYRLKRLLHL